MEATSIGNTMLDATILAITLLFFAAALAYLFGCDCLR
jgi:hypothetical protein